MDTMIASYLVNASRRYHALEDLAAERLKLEVPVLPVPDRKDPYRTPTLDERLVRAGAGAVAAARLGEQFADELVRLNLDRLYRDVELPLVDVLVEMEEAGIAVDVAYLRNLGEEFAREVARIEQEAFAAVGHEFGLNSPKQLQSLLFEELKLPRGRRTGTGFSTDATVLAHVSQDPALLDAFRSGADIHRRTAAAGFGVAESAVTREQRDVAKMLNFGIIYGMSDFGLAWRMQMPREEAQRFIDEYFKRYGQVRRYVLETKAFCVEQGYVETLLGRRRYIPDMTSRVNAVRNAAERMAINMPIQGTAADIMKIAMARVHRALHDSDLHARVLLQVHDELVAEVPRLEVERMARLLGDEMSAAYRLDVPLVVDVRAGPNWDEMQRLEVAAAA